MPRCVWSANGADTGECDSRRPAHSGFLTLVVRGDWNEWNWRRHSITIYRDGHTFINFYTTRNLEADRINYRTNYTLTLDTDMKVKQVTLFFQDGVDGNDINRAMQAVQSATGNNVTSGGYTPMDIHMTCFSDEMMTYHFSPKRPMPTAKEPK